MLWRIFITYGLVFAAFSALYILSFRMSLFHGQDVLFYRGIYLLVFASAVLLIAGIAICRAYFPERLESFIAALALSAAFHLCFFVIFPVTFERSVTMYLLRTLGRVETTEVCDLSKEELRETLIREYIIERDAVGKRLHEQRVIDFVNSGDQCIALTSRGSEFLKFSRVVETIYGLR